MAETPSIFEFKWPTVVLTPISVSQNAVTVSSTYGLHTQQVVALSKIGLPTLELEIKRVVSDTVLWLGPIGPSQVPFANPVTYSGGTLTASEQERPRFGQDIIWRAVYEEGPAVAIRNVLVDWAGNHYTADNPLPIAFDGTISVGDVQISGPPSGTKMSVNPDGSINVNIIESVGSTNIIVNTASEVTAVASGISTNLVTYTVPADKRADLQAIYYSGENIAKYDVLINGNRIDTQRTWFSGGLNGSFDFRSSSIGGYTLAAGDVVVVTVIHYRPALANFEGRIQVMEEPL